MLGGRVEGPWMKQSGLKRKGGELQRGMPRRTRMRMCLGWELSEARSFLKKRTGGEIFRLMSPNLNLKLLLSQSFPNCQ